MRNGTSILIPFVLVSIFNLQDCFGQTETSSLAPLKLGIVQDKSMSGDCGCSVYLNVTDSKRARYLLLSNADGDAIVNLDGRDIRLRLVRQKEKSWNPKIGDRSWTIYAVGELSVRVDFVVARVCDPNDESCEVTWYNVKLTVSRTRRHASRQR